MCESKLSGPYGPSPTRSGLSPDSSRLPSSDVSPCARRRASRTKVPPVFGWWMKTNLSVMIMSLGLSQRSRRACGDPIRCSLRFPFLGKITVPCLLPGREACQLVAEARTLSGDGFVEQLVREVVQLDFK